MPESPYSGCALNDGGLLPYKGEEKVNIINSREGRFMLKKIDAFLLHCFWAFLAPSTAFLHCDSSKSSQRDVHTRQEI